MRTISENWGESNGIIGDCDIKGEGMGGKINDLNSMGPAGMVWEVYVGKLRGIWRVSDEESEQRWPCLIDMMY